MKFLYPTLHIKYLNHSFPKLSYKLFSLGLIVVPIFIQAQSPSKFLNSLTNWETSDKSIGNHSDSTKTESRKHGVRLGAQLGVQFSDFSHKNVFSQSLQTLIQNRYQRDTSAIAGDTTLTARTSRILQNYDPVQIFFPVGLSASWTLSPYFDLLMDVQGLWSEQTAIVEQYEVGFVSTPNPSSSQPFKYGIETVLVGLGFRYYFPDVFLTIDNGQHLFIAYSRYWNLPGGQLYSEGTAPIEFNNVGSGNEFSIGYYLYTWGKWEVLGQMTYTDITFKSSHRWSAISVMDSSSPDNIPIKAGFQSLKFNFQLNHPIYLF